MLHRAPLGRAVLPRTIFSAIRRAFDRSDLTAELHGNGTHILRHTAATRMYRQGATLKEVADVLGHQCIDTTTIYTKVDLPTLARIAMPWPEVDS